MQKLIDLHGHGVQVPGGSRCWRLGLGRPWGGGEKREEEEGNPF